MRLKTVGALAVATPVLAFTARRLVLLVAALLPPRPLCGGSFEPPSVLLLVPARNEMRGIDRLLDALERLSYPSERLFVALVNDGSDDGTGVRLAVWAAHRSRVMAVDLPRPVGKAQALNHALAGAPSSELVAVCDADLQPRPDWLLRLARAFTDPSVGAAACFIAPTNVEKTAIARYAAVEAWAHQLVTSAGKDRLDLNPPTLGGAVFRRSALEAIGGFSGSSPGDDVRAATALIRAGWRTRFVRSAIADHEVVHEAREYWQQHVRWARNVFAATEPSRRGSRTARPLARMEVRMSTAGYLDRLAFLAALGLTRRRALPRWVPAVYVAAAAAEVAVAVAKAGRTRQSHRLFLSTVVVFPLDVAASIHAVCAHVLRRPRAWPSSSG